MTTYPTLSPRVIRAKYAPQYLGMCRDVFNREVKPRVCSIPIGRQGVGYDRLELDAWLEHHKQCNGCPAKQPLGGTLCQSGNIDDQASIGATSENLGLSIKSGRVSEYTLSLTRINQMKPKHY